MKALVFLLLFCLSSFTNQAKSFEVYKDIPYQERKSADARRNLLDVYAPKDKSHTQEVLIFIHGGSWSSGRKDIYKFIGKRMAKKNSIAVIINYRLHPEVPYTDMVLDCANAVKWVSEHIESYGGNKNKIFVSGHSAGGHLAAYLTLNTVWDSLKIKNPIKGCVLIDAFGLDMYAYLRNYNHVNPAFFEIFTKDPKIWKEGSPVYHIPNNPLPVLIFYGGKTYPAIQNSSRKYYEAIKEKNGQAEVVVMKRKKHILMILQMYSSKNIIYEKIIPFLKT